MRKPYVSSISIAKRPLTLMSELWLIEATTSLEVMMQATKE